MYNSHVIISSTGEIVGAYDKTHLFDVELPEKNIKLKESDYVEKGGSIVEPVNSPIGKIGLGIVRIYYCKRADYAWLICHDFLPQCYDLRFPELSLSLARKGAEILTYPSAFTIPTGNAHWRALLRSRAIETQCYVVAAAQTGSHNAKRSSYGHAMVRQPRWLNVGFFLEIFWSCICNPVDRWSMGNCRSAV